jgi:manganese efflux pump family protein
MDLLTLIGTALALAMDAFAVSAAVAASLSGLTARQVFRLSWHFGLFQFLMPVIGWAAGSSLAGYLASVDHWVAFGLLALLGVHMIWSSFRDSEKGARRPADPTRGVSLLALALATSIDALAVGVSLGFLRIDIWLPSATIGVVTAAMSVVGTALGRRLGHLLGEWAERVAGLVLIGIGLRILLSHLLA